VLSRPTDAVVLDSLEVRIAGRTILGPIDLRVGAGERWIVMGPNGSGKTTMLRVVGARRQPSRGSATVLGYAIGRDDLRPLLPRISHASHALSELMPAHMRVEDVVLTGKYATLTTWLQDYDDDDRRVARRRLRAVGCEGLVRRRIDGCSQGERQRILLARALFGDPDLLLLDEPAAGLDFAAREALVHALEGAMTDRGTTMVIATHHLEEIPPSATHAVLLRDGLIVAAGSIDDTLTAAALTACFGLDVEIGRRAGRWWAVAG
jgi:iron complex transport system ATP-binding protein